MNKKCILCTKSKVYKNEKNKVTINHNITKCTIKECLTVMNSYKPPKTESPIMGRWKDE